MKRRKSLFSLVLALMVIGVGMLPGAAAFAADAGGVTLFTPYTDISVTPGQTINYSIDVINNGSSVQDVAIGLDGLGSDWNSQITSGGWTIQRIAVKPGDTQSIDLQVDVPLKVNKGEYKFYVTADGQHKLALNVNVTEQGTFSTEFTSDQPNMQGTSDATFTFSAMLKNRTADDQTYSLTSDAKKGWDVSFVKGSDNVTSVKVKAGESQDITISIKPPANVKAGEFNIPVKASTSNTSANLTLDCVVKGNYSLQLTGPNGILSTDVTTGHEKSLNLTIKNTGSADLKDISLSSSLPNDWNVTFKPDSKIDSLAAGQSTNVTAIIKPSDKAIAGDYVATLTAGTPETTDSADFRVTVKTSMLWGWIAILIVLAVIGVVYYLFRTYGRR